MTIKKLDKAKAKYAGVYPYDGVPQGFIINNCIGRSRANIGRNGSKKEPVYYGMEIELQFDGVVDPRGHRLELEDKASRIMNKACVDKKFVFYAKRDGTVRGLEFVTSPMTLSAWVANEDNIKRFVRVCKANGAQAGKSKDGSIHIHVSKSAFKNIEHLRRFISIFKLNKDYFSQISNRRKNDLDKFASIDHSMEVDPKSDNNIKNLLSPIKYGAVRLTRNTVEIRIFKNSLLTARILGIIQLIDILIAYSGRDAIGDSDLNIKSIVDWAKVLQEKWLKNSWKLGVLLLSREPASKIKTIETAEEIA